MILFPISELKVDTKRTLEIKTIVESTLRLIAYSRQHLADDLLNSYITKTTSFKELLSIRNAQMEAQSEDEANAYAVLLRQAMGFITDELKKSINLTSEVQLFQLFRLVSPDSHVEHPNKYRNTLVQIGQYLCPDPKEVPPLVSELFFQIERIQNPIIRAIYFHHELIRIHPFVDGNGRTVRMAKNWMLMYELYSPIFISGSEEKKEYIETLEKSFLYLNKNPGMWNVYLESFFNQELNRLKKNCLSVYDFVSETGNYRGK